MFYAFVLRLADGLLSSRYSNPHEDAYMSPKPQGGAAAGAAKAEEVYM